MKTYIHYGCPEFKREKFVMPSTRKYNNKPKGGLWASDVNAKYGWKNWCEENGWDGCSLNQSFSFHLSNKANVIHINWLSDLHQLPEQDCDLELTCLRTVDYEKLIADGIDAIEFNISNDWNLYMGLYGWDCDSLLVLNPDVIEII